MSGSEWKCFTKNSTDIERNAPESNLCIYTVSDFYDYKHILIGLRRAKGCVIDVWCVFIFLWKSNLSVWECKCSEELYSSMLLIWCPVNTVLLLFQSLTSLSSTSFFCFWGLDMYLFFFYFILSDFFFFCFLTALYCSGTLKVVLHSIGNGEPLFAMWCCLK